MEVGGSSSRVNSVVRARWRPQHSRQIFSSKNAIPQVLGHGVPWEKAMSSDRGLHVSPSSDVVYLYHSARGDPQANVGGFVKNPATSWWHTHPAWNFSADSMKSHFVLAVPRRELVGKRARAIMSPYQCSKSTGKMYHGSKPEQCYLTFVLPPLLGMVNHKSRVRIPQLVQAYFTQRHLTLSKEIKAGMKNRHVPVYMVTLQKWIKGQNTTSPGNDGRTMFEHKGISYRTNPFTSPVFPIENNYKSNYNHVLVALQKLKLDE
jgi:hypothetical protein